MVSLLPWAWHGRASWLKQNNTFSSVPGVEVFKEPVDEWRNFNGDNLLALMYEDPNKWSLAFQTYVQLTMVKIHTKKQNPNLPIKLMERSIFSARYCFVENLFRSGKLSKVEYNVICEYFNWLTQNIPMKPDLIVYLQTDPSILHDRILQRSRKEESKIQLVSYHMIVKEAPAIDVILYKLCLTSVVNSLRYCACAADDYLTTLHEAHEDWLIHEKSFPVPCPVMVMDANKNLKNMLNDFEECKNSIFDREPTDMNGIVL
ncbi:Deoxynucleoside kinase [Nymphon striatum]|nr:Deoxynucleoside kinase [Nymphon striatum]